MRYEPDLTKVQATLTLFKKGDYEFLVGEPKSFQRNNAKGDLSVGVRYQLTLADDNGQYKKGSKQLFSCYIHSDDAMKFSKRFIAATLGINMATEEEEKKFDEQFKGLDWGIEPDTGAVSDIWRQPVGRRVVATTDIGINPNDGSQTQQFKGFRPVTA